MFVNWALGKMGIDKMQIICNTKCKWFAIMDTEHLLKDIKKTGLKITAPRKEILNALSSNLLSAQEVAMVLKEKGFNTDLVTIYRTLELFTELEIVRKTQFEDKSTRFELIAGQEHHHHLVCIKCGIVEDVVVDEEMLTKQIEEKSQFKLQRHALEFFGFCKRCQ